ncbi:MAG: F-type H+-transporting ATPase subunit b [Bradymonadia bacterium]|jgi:F-type H+-transporting ATPase subunit b
MMRLIIGLLLLSSPAYAEGGGWMTMVWHAVNLVILLVLIVKFAGKGVKAGLAARAEAVTQEIDDASALHAQAQTMLTEYESKMVGLQAELDTIRAQYTTQGEAEKARLIAEGEAEAARIKADAERAAQNEFTRARARLEAELIDRAVDAAEDLIKARMTPADQRRLTAEYLSRLEETSRA